MAWLTGMMLFLLVGTRPAVAQHQIHHPDRSAPEEAGGTRVMIDMMHSPMTGMMRHHMQMMQQMMQDPLRRSAMLVHVLPSLQEPLVLSDEQAAQLRQHAQQFKEQKKAHQQQMKQAKAQLQELMASGDAAPERVRAQLEEAARHHAQMQALAYETAEQMKGVLTAEQQATLTKMKPMQLHHHMMMNMTMMEMMQALQPGMMSCGMMQGGMTEMKKNTNGTGAD